MGASLNCGEKKQTLYGMLPMPTLKTRNYEVHVEPTDVLHLVVPVGIAKAGISKLSPTKFMVRYWDTNEMKLRYRTFDDMPAAEQFKEQMTCVVLERLLRDVTVADIMANQKYFQTFYRIQPQATDYEAREVPLPPRMLGTWLGDGSSIHCAITSVDPEIVEYITQVASSFGLYVKKDHQITHYITKMKPGETRTTTDSVSSGVLLDREQLDKALQDMANNGISCPKAAKKHNIGEKALRRYRALWKAGELDQYYDERRPNPITAALKALGVWGNKHIPKCYLENSREARLELLAGLVDTDGHTRTGHYDFVFKSRRLLADVVILARSLGFMAKDPKYVRKVCTNAVGGPKVCEAYRSSIWGGHKLLEVPVLLARKVAQPGVQRYDQVPFEIMKDNI